MRLGGQQSGVQVSGFLAAARRSAQCVPPGALRWPNGRSYGWRSTIWPGSNPSALAPGPTTGLAARRRSRWPGCNSPRVFGRALVDLPADVVQVVTLAQRRDDGHRLIPPAAAAELPIHIG